MTNNNLQCSLELELKNQMSQALQTAQNDLKSFAKVAQNILKNTSSHWEQLPKKITSAFDKIPASVASVAGFVTNQMLNMATGASDMSQVVSTSLSTLGESLMAMGGWFTVAGVAVEAFSVAYQTNFLGIQDITNQTITYIGEQIMAFSAYIYDGFIATIMALPELFKPAIDSISKAWTAFTTSFMENFNQMVTAFQPIADFIVGALTVLAGGIMGVLVSIAGFFQDNLNLINQIVAGFVTGIINRFKTFTDLVMGIFTTFFLLLQRDWSGAWESIKETLGEFIKNIIEVLKSDFEFISGIIKLALEGILAILNVIFENIKTAWGNFWWGLTTVVEKVFNTVKEPIEKFFGWLEEKIKRAYKKIKDLAGLPGQIINGAGEMISGAASAVAGGVSSAASSVVNGATGLASSVADGASWAWGSITNFLATGGVVTRPTVAMIGEGAYNEAVVPLPDGSRIPVEMRGNTGNNININFEIKENYLRSENDLENLTNLITQKLTRSLQLNQLSSL